VEIIDWLANLAKHNLALTGYTNIRLRQGDGYAGWPEAAPFDAIELTAAAPRMPSILKRQLKIGGRLLAPVGRNVQRLVLIERISDEDYREQHLLPVQFVPMTGTAQ
jgi:protein-L-isoaspartate(D-aspartate) O-methyltransferase